MTLFARLYAFWAPRRPLLYAGVVALILVGILGLRSLRLEENVAALLPDGTSEVAVDFALLEEAPFARKILISLEVADHGQEDLLAQGADRLARTLGPPLFGRVAAGPAQMSEGALLFWVSENLPSLLTDEDLVRFAAGMDGDEVAERVRQVREQLLLPEGWALKELFRRDPLGLHRLGLEKLRHLNLVPGARLRDGRFVSDDGRHALVIAETPVAITDSARGREMLAELDGALSGLPPGVTATVVSGHRYTAANASVIQRDLGVTLGASTAALAALFILFLRHWRGIFPFLLPVAVVCLASAFLGIVYRSVSAMTLGFGAVLLGISVDFAVHVFFALRRGGGDPAGITADVARPVLFGGLTTIAAFAVLLGSELPGQRQLAVFAIVGLALALLLALIVLPHLIPPGRGEAGEEKAVRSQRRLPRGLVIGIWGAVLAFSAVPALKLQIDGDLRHLSLVPPGLREAEQALQKRWGNLRGKALVFAEGTTAEEALAANDRLFDFLERRLPGESVTLAPLLPSAARQARHREGWNAFWQEGEGRRIAADLQEAAARAGFAEGAFAPFLASLKAESAPIDPDWVRRAGLSEIVDALVVQGEGRWRLVSLVPDTRETVALFADHRDELPGVRLVSQTRFGEEVSRAVGRDFGRFLLLAALTVTALVALLFRRPWPVLLAMVPVATGLTVMFGVMGGIGLTFNLVNVMATVLVIGLCVDYGIFMVCRLSGQNDHATSHAVLVSGLTTLAGFGALVLARHPALHSIGVTVLIGIGAAIPAALLVVPALGRREG